MSTIFITIPAYEDPLLIDTIEGALSNAAHPENLHFAIALMYDELPQLDKYTKNFKFIRYEKSTRPALNLIRHKLFSMHDGEDYLLMVDSHTLFAPNWDTDLLSELSELQNIHGKKVLISKQVPDMTGSILAPKGTPSVMHEKTTWEIDPDDSRGFLIQLWAMVKPCDQDPGYYLVNHASGHFLFAPGEFVSDVGILPVQGHYAQEEMLSYISFMRGWSIYARSDYLHIGHNSVPYNRIIYNADSMGKDEKTWGIQQDEKDTLIEIENMFLYNSGRFKIETDKQPVDFYRSVGIGQEFLNYLDRNPRVKGMDE